MAKITLKTVKTKKEWEGFLSQYPEVNFLQSWYWGEFHKAIGNKIHRSGFYKNDQLVGVMLCVVEDAKRGRYLIVPAGPLIDWKDTGQVEAFVDEIKRIAKLNGCIFVRVRPQLKSSDFSKRLFSKYGFKSAPMHLHAELTSQVVLTKTKEELLASMRKSTRYEIRKSISLGVKVTSTNDPSALRDFYNLQVETSKRQNFIPFTYKFLKEQFEIFSKIGKALLYSAMFEKKLLAQAFIIFYGKEAVYHYGASTKEGRKYPGAYLIQWEAIKEAKRRGMKRYNFWGVAPKEQKDHRFYGVSVFKRGFGGQDVNYLHAQDLIIDKLNYMVDYAVESIRKRIRNL